jgi:hypothetical protein
LLLVRQRNSLLRNKATADTFNVLIELLCIDVALNVSADVSWRKLLTGSLNA